MRWTVIFCALMLAACDVRLMADGGDGIDCGVRWRQIVADVENAAETRRGCATDDDCTVFYWSTKCLTACGTAINVAEQAEMEAEVARISSERCTEKHMQACGIASSCEQTDAKCKNGICEQIPHDWAVDGGTPDAGDADPCDPDLYCAQVDENGCCGDSFGKVSDCMTPEVQCPPGMKPIHMSDCKCSGMDAA
ncbi:MAG: hypothetical protein HY897_09595 [Deltaproteobacteria bacterium]|nr:hypothetical protein [Deltaproteobacteria bacterium]